MDTIDLRSDTITRPTPAMCMAMANAKVGDDVFGEDPTVIRLEEMAAERMGKPAALFVASGTMGNLVSQLAHCRRGDEILLGDQSHVFIYEQGGSAAVGGLHPRILPNASDGTIGLDILEGAIRPDDVHFPRTGLILLENTHNRCGGRVLSPDYVAAVGRLARRNGIRLHMDGARIFNAAIALDRPPADLVAAADSVTFCLSKALGAPVGSVVCGEKRFIAEARRMRKLLGGGMRQAGVLAAAGIVALEEMVPRLAEDHENARRLAQGLTAIAGLVVDMATVETNLVYIKVAHATMTAPVLVDRLAEKGLKVLAASREYIRAVPTYHVSTRQIDAAVRIFRQCLGPA
ncbi:MAG: low-specificity L-threonine aldolase [Desulfosarcinaceae bacterium]|nr:low-specificity L-threonine aldolase [Desulfosarcinaceae bacterium]